MSMETDSTDSEKPVINKKKMYIQAVVYIVTTALTAYILAVFGYIPFDPITAAISGIFVGCILVLYKSCYWNRTTSRSQDTTL